MYKLKELFINVASKCKKDGNAERGKIWEELAEDNNFMLTLAGDLALANCDLDKVDFKIHTDAFANKTFNAGDVKDVIEFARPVVIELIKGVVPPPGVPTSFNVTFRPDNHSELNGAADPVVVQVPAVGGVADLSGLSFPAVTIKASSAATRERDADKWTCQGAATGVKTEAEIKGLQINKNLTVTVVTKGK